jgi:CDP-4-dehydro-6-deoxyglucose reductase
MPFQVRVEPSGHEFPVLGDDTLLAAALRAGLSFDYGCSNGNCGRCRVRLVAGQVQAVRHHDFVLGEAERLAGTRLACTVRPCSDLVIEAGEATAVDQLPEQHVTAQVRDIEQFGARLTSVTLRTPRSQRLRFLAGQHVRLALPGSDASQLLPVASCPCEEGRLRFHVVAARERPFAEALFAGRLRRFGEVTVSGPYGAFVIPAEAVCDPLLFIAVGSGFAPVRSLVEHAIALDEQCPIDLWRIATPATGTYLDNWCRSWADALDDFGFRWLDGYAASAGQALAAAFTALRARGRARRIYLAGPPAAVAELAALLRATAGEPLALNIESTGIDP